jgi:hypothetical protein
MEASMTPTAWDLRNKLTVILNTAKHSGEPYVDVESGYTTLHPGLETSKKPRKDWTLYEDA